MEKQELGTSKILVSPITFGAWQIGGEPFWQNGSEADAMEAINMAVECGINLFDTAAVYGFGRSEKLLGKAVKSYRDKILIATKCGLRWEKEELPSMYNDLSPTSIRQEVENSLKRLGTDWIDLYQIHCPSPKHRVEPAIEEMEKLQKQGKIRAIGVSNFSLSLLKQAMEVACIDSIQPKYSLLEREVEEELLPFCIKNSIAVLPYSPLASGLLTCKYNFGDSFGDWRDRGKMGIFQKDKLGKAFERVERFKQIADEHGLEPRLLAIAWVMSRGGITSPIIGVKSKTHIKSNMAALKISIDAELTSKLEAV